MSSDQSLLESVQQFNRRQFLQRSRIGLGALALGSLVNEGMADDRNVVKGLPELPHFAPKAKRVIYMFQSGRLLNLSCSTTNRSLLSFKKQNCLLRFERGSV